MHPLYTKWKTLGTREHFFNKTSTRFTLQKREIGGPANV